MHRSLLLSEGDETFQSLRREDEWHDKDMPIELGQPTMEDMFSICFRKAPLFWSEIIWEHLTTRHNVKAMISLRSFPNKLS